VTEQTINYVGPKPPFEFFTDQMSAGNNITYEQWQNDIPDV